MSFCQPESLSSALIATPTPFPQALQKSSRLLLCASKYLELGVTLTRVCPPKGAHTFESPVAFSVLMMVRRMKPRQRQNDLLKARPLVFFL